MEFNIQDLVITQTAKKLKVQPGDINYESGNFIARYWLFDADGREIETGTKTIPIQYIGFLTQNPVSIPEFNQLLASWNITAIDQITT